MKFKKLLASSLLCGLCIFSSIPVHASEVEGPDTGIQRTEAALTDGVTRASWGTGTLIHENPLGRKPWAYAKTSTYAGNAYSIKARTKVTSGGYTDYTSWATNNYSLSYDFFIQNTQASDYNLNIKTNTSYTLCNLDFPSIMINTDFDENADGVKLPPPEINAKAGSTVNLAYRIGQIGAADSQLLIVTLNYHQTQINNADYLLVDTEASKTAYGTLALTAPSEKGLYEICALVVPDPTKPNDFLPLENAYRFTLNVI